MPLLRFMEPYTSRVNATVCKSYLNKPDLEKEKINTQIRANVSPGVRPDQMCQSWRVESNAQNVCGTHEGTSRKAVMSHRLTRDRQPREMTDKAGGMRTLHPQGRLGRALPQGPDSSALGLQPLPSAQLCLQPSNCV